MDKYRYDGPVVEYGRCISNNWKGETMANSEPKARSNLTYQFKKQTNRLPTAKISLPGKVIKYQKGG